MSEIFWRSAVPTCLRLPKGESDGTARLITKCSQIYMMDGGRWVLYASSHIDLTKEPKETMCNKCDAKCLVAQLAWK